MSKLIILIAGTAILSTSGTTLVSLLRSEVASIAETTPTDYKTYINGIAVHPFSVTETFEIADIGILKTKHNFPDELYRQFELILYSNSVTLQSFTLILTKHGGLVCEYIGAASRNGSTVKMALIGAVAMGTVMKKNLILSEVEIVNRTLRSLGYKAVLGLINSLPQSVAPGGDQDLSATFGSGERFEQVFDLLTSKAPVYSLNGEYKAVILPRTGQLFVGKSEFDFTDSTMHLNVDNYGLVLGTPNDSGRKTVLQLNKINGTISLTNGATEPFYGSTDLLRTGVSPYRISVGNTGGLFITDGNGSLLYDTEGKARTTSVILGEMQRIYSRNGEFYCIVQADGLFVLYRDLVKHGQGDDQELWRGNAEVEGNGPFSLEVSRNGTMTLRARERVFWEMKAGNKGIPVKGLVVTDEGRINVLDARKKVVWMN